MAPFISLRGVQKQYRLGEVLVHAVCGVDLELSQGEFTALVGPSGSGKTTLLNLIGCIDEPDSGSIWVDGVDVSKLGEKALSRFRNQKIGFVFQSFNLVPVLTVYENVELPLLINDQVPASQRRDRVLAAIRDVGLEAYLRHPPDKLSGGQRQRVAIARALGGEPLLVLADEPTANLDSETAQKIIDLMVDLNRQRKVTFLFSTHDEKVMSRVQRVIRIQDGKVSS